LVHQRRDWQNRSHFFGIAARIMRRILVDKARRRLAAKRAGLSGERITLSGIADASGGKDVDVLNLHEALTRLAVMDPRQASLVELKYFGGLTIEEVAESATISPATVKRELRTATLWLRREMARC
jgi:RNA polymerase sigma factor (TIGR02999 family)